MGKIIVRNTVLKGKTNSSFIDLCGGNDFNSFETILSCFSIREIMKGVFEEDLLSDSLENSLIYESYNSILQDQKDNDFFSIMYKIDNEFAIHISQNIYIYHLSPKIELLDTLFQWYYTDSKKYIGDSWWEEDEEIINSLQTLNVIEFLKRYKGY